MCNAVQASAMLENSKIKLLSIFVYFCEKLQQIKIAYENDS